MRAEAGQKEVGTEITHNPKWTGGNIDGEQDGCEAKQDSGKDEKKQRKRY